MREVSETGDDSMFAHGCSVILINNSVNTLFVATYR